MRKQIFIVGEIGINHNGDMSICKKLIDTAVDAGCDAVSAVLRKRGVVVHELSKASTQNEFIGLEFGPIGGGHLVSVKRSRLWRLRGALDAG